jgi:hypothetical protein
MEEFWVPTHSIQLGVHSFRRQEEHFLIEG